MEFKLYIDVDGDKCKKILKNNGFCIGHACIDSEIIDIIDITSLSDIKEIQKVLDYNPYPVNDIAFEFPSDDDQLPKMFIDND